MQTTDNENEHKICGQHQFRYEIWRSTVEPNQFIDTVILDLISTYIISFKQSSLEVIGSSFFPLSDKAFSETCSR